MMAIRSTAAKAGEHNPKARRSKEKCIKTMIKTL